MITEENVIETDVELTKKGTVRKRKPKKKNTYFTEETEEAILQYRLEKKEYNRNKLYREKIHHAFYKLAENIIHSFKFYYIDTNSVEDLKYEVISFLLQKINLYDQSKGKAYSYFGTITKRYLIAYNQKNYKKLLAKVDLSEIHNDNNTIDILVDKLEPKEIDKEIVFDKFLQKLDLMVLDMFNNENEIRVAVALLEIFKTVKNMETVNKKYIFLCAKEMTGESTNTITKVIKSMKSVYKDVLSSEMEEFMSEDIYSYEQI
jgi:hypothetical protein